MSRGPRDWLAVATVLLGLLPVAGCGGDDRPPAQLTGDRVAAMAERELEAENPEAAPAEMTCSDLEFRIGASTRCSRVAGLSGGRWVRVYGTVRVTGTADGGSLHVQMDDEAAEFGLSGDRVGALLRDQVGAESGISDVECPALTGEIGTSLVCSAERDGEVIRLRATVIAVDADRYDATLRFDALSD